MSPRVKVVAPATLDAEGVSLDVVDLRTPFPWDRDAVIAQARAQLMAIRQVLAD